MEEKEIVEAEPILKDAVSAENAFSREIIVGAEVGSYEYNDGRYMDLLYKHFNAVTLGNELKLDCMTGYHDGNRTPLGLETVLFKGREIVVPRLDHSRADRILDGIAARNASHPEQKLKVRGHVFVWHSQAPEWFFHEDYNASKPYAGKDEMNVRLEWYIKTMLSYYTDPATETGRKYASLFYGWDVVNEAVSDATGSYRTDTEAGSDKLSDPTHGTKSSWWHVYKSNEFIINAFRYANAYAPASLELYYNDYNECDPKKRAGIVELLKAVKDAEGTRISAMGMQGHYDMDYPSVSLVKDAARAYCAIVGSVMLTEVDLKASKGFNGTVMEGEYKRQAVRYKALYDSLLELDKEDGVTVSGINFWGITDPYSWLQTFSGVGGGADGTKRQCPLLFDGDYRAKPAFYSFIK